MSLPVSFTVFSETSHATTTEAPQEEDRQKQLLVHRGRGETYFGNVTDVGYDNARRLFSAHIQSLVEEEPGSKSKRLTADELIDLFLDSATDQSRGFCLPSWVKVVTSPFANPSTP